MKRIKNLWSEEVRQRSTAQRELLLNLIRESEGHMDAAELYERARGKQPRLSLSTVYRNLSLFKKLGLVEEHQFANAHRYYEANLRSRHQHLVCLGCGEIFEFNCPSVEKVRAKISKDSGFEVIDTEVCLTGYCPRCRRRLSGNETDTGIEQQIAERR